MDCSPQGFNHRSQHLQIHPAMHKTTLNKTKLWKIKSPPLWPVLVASDYLNPYGICDLQICDIYNLTKNLYLCLHSTTTPNLLKISLKLFPKHIPQVCLLQFPLLPSVHLPACTDSGPLHSGPLATTDGPPGFHPRTQSQNKNDTHFTFCLFICKIVYFFPDEELISSLCIFVKSGKSG